MTTSGSIEKKVRRLENDVHDAYIILTDILTIQKQHTNQLVSIEAKLGGHDARFDSVEAKLGVHDARLDSVEARFDSLQGTLDQVLELVQRRD